ncbi:hypothetical protein [Anaerosphaera multitolerans]|uniref:Uncharacterized protein n=1 Tax=Anaerosphaera multitolerans TaxID=2487351 RepID=A0A437S9A1_9FIRM|nr:hypothetical protein [Anaerosphaera multitolerans]RVU55700.1 hypothetical protein EF514_00345 [Anaerosphaera multitolerans]
MRKKLIFITIFLLSITAVFVLSNKNPYIKTITKSKIDVDNININAMDGIEFKNTIPNNISFYKVKPPKESKSFSIDIYKAYGEEINKYSGVLDNYEFADKKGFELALGTISNLPLIKFENFEMTIPEDGKEISESEVHFTGFSTLEGKKEFSKLREPIILKTLCFSKIHGAAFSNTDYLNMYKLNKDYNYYFFTITFYDWDIIEEDKIN